MPHLEDDGGGRAPGQKSPKGERRFLPSASGVCTDNGLKQQGYASRPLSQHPGQLDQGCKTPRVGGVSWAGLGKAKFIDIFSKSTAFTGKRGRLPSLG